MKTFIGAAAVCVAAAFVAPVSADPVYRLESAVALKSPKPDWDYLTLDAPRGYLFIGRRGEGVVVYNVKTKKVVKTIADSDDANHIVLVPEFDRGYSTNGDGTSTAFQLSTLKTIARIHLGEDADAGVYDPLTKQIAFTMGDSKAIAFVDAKTGQVVGKLAMDSSKLDGTVADEVGNLFMALRDKNAIVKIAVAQREVVATWPTAPCEQPTGIAYDKANRRLFVGCRGKAPVLAVLDATSGRVITTQDIGRGNDGVVYDAVSKKVITSNGVDANLVVYDQADADTYKLSAAITTRPYARTMAFDPASKKLYLVTAEGMADPAQKINKAVATFYPNRYFPDTFTVLTYAPK